jgi:hypothetical protein
MIHWPSSSASWTNEEMSHTLLDPIAAITQSQIRNSFCSGPCETIPSFRQHYITGIGLGAFGEANPSSSFCQARQAFGFSTTFASG